VYLIDPRKFRTGQNYIGSAPTVFYDRCPFVFRTEPDIQTCIDASRYAAPPA
jgi:hypothetical protein